MSLVGQGRKTSKIIPNGYSVDLCFSWVLVLVGRQVPRELGLNMWPHRPPLYASRSPGPIQSWNTTIGKDDSLI